MITLYIIHLYWHMITIHLITVNIYSQFIRLKYMNWYWWIFARVCSKNARACKCILKPTSANNNHYYIPINVISLDNVDFTECDPMLWITTLWFSESISPLSETDDVVHNVFLNTNAWGIVTSSYHTIQNMYHIIYLFQNEAYKSYS